MPSLVGIGFWSGFAEEMVFVNPDALESLDTSSKQDGVTCDNWTKGETLSSWHFGITHTTIGGLAAFPNLHQSLVDCSKPRLAGSSR